jgi:hypothetical protein
VSHSKPNIYCFLQCLPSTIIWSQSQQEPRSPSLFTAHLAPCASSSEPSKCHLPAMILVISSILQCPILMVLLGHAAGWHQGIGMWETLLALKCMAFRKDLPQPLWKLCLNLNYDTLPCILLEALQSPRHRCIHLLKCCSVNGYICKWPTCHPPEGCKVLDILLKWTSFSFWGLSHGCPSLRQKSIGKCNAPSGALVGPTWTGKEYHAMAATGTERL